VWSGSDRGTIVAKAAKTMGILLHLLIKMQRIYADALKK
jgi:hypothetical protein